MKTVLLVSYLATLAAVPYLILLKKRPAATLAWLWAIIFIPFLGPLIYVLFGTDRLKRRRLKYRTRYSPRPSRQRAPSSATDEATAGLIEQLPRRERQFLQLLSRINQLPASSATEARILRNTAEFYPALEQRIREAKHHVHLEFYLWRGDETGRRFLRLLTETVRRGVKVRMLLDGVGSFGLGRAELKDFRAAGGEFAWFQSLDPMRGRFVLNLRNHRKLQIVDGAIAFVGGMNIGREYEGLDPQSGHWRDVQVEAIGPVVETLQEVFADDWFFATGRKITAAPASVRLAMIPMNVLVGGADRANEPLSKSIVSLINEATERIWIATGYFVPDDVLLAALELAASRGVDVRLLVAEKNDHQWLVTAGRSYYDELLAAGVRIFEYSAGTNHAKIAVADAHWAMVGSANLDYRSMRLNFELNLLFRSAEHNATLAGILEHDFELSQEIDPAVFARRPFRSKLAEAALRPLSPML
jgi:cardiolipin synthase A/B